MHDPDRVVLNAGWHFSFLTETDDVRPKLDTMFVAGEVEWRGFRDGIRSDWQGSVSQLIEARRGFHDHMYAGSVWAHVNLGELRCEVVERAVLDFPGLLLPPPADLPEEVELRGALSRCGACTTVRCPRSFTTRRSDSSLPNSRHAGACWRAVPSVGFRHVGYKGRSKPTPTLPVAAGPALHPHL